MSHQSDFSPQFSPKYSSLYVQCKKQWDCPLRQGIRASRLWLTWNRSPHT